MVKQVTPLFHVELQPSNSLKKAIAIVHGLALAASLANALPVAIKMLIAAAVSVHLGHALKKAASVRESIRYSEALGWEIAEQDEFQKIEVLDSTVLTRLAVWLHVKRQTSTRRFFNRQHLLIMYDALSESDYRSLIVKLKTTCHKPN